MALRHPADPYADLARFLDANLHPQATPIRSAIEAIQRPHPSPAGSVTTGLGWHISQRAGRSVLWHNGGTGGFMRAAGAALAKKNRYQYDNNLLSSSSIVGGARWLPWMKGPQARDCLAGG